MSNSQKKDKLVFESSGQSGRFVATYNPHSQPDDKVFIYQLIGDNATSWSITYSEAQVISANRDVSVVDKSNMQGQGLFNIGQNKNWLYTKSIHPDPQAFKNEILDLIAFSLRG